MNNMNPMAMQGMGMPMQSGMQGNQNFPMANANGMKDLLLGALRSTPVPAGWQATVRPDDRYPLLLQL